MPGHPVTSMTEFKALQAAFAGQFILPSDPEYDRARQVHNGMIDRRPALIAACNGSADIVDALGFATGQGMEIAVRGGGHNVGGRAVCDDGIMIDLSGMKGIWVDPAARRARAEAGVTWGEFNRATQLHGLATTGGAVGSTGIAGLTLGGGFGYLMGRHGLTIDNLTSAQMVTSDGRVVTASAHENTELFWGLRGGGGNFGIVSSFEYQLHPVGPEIAGGLIAFDIADIGHVLEYAAWLADNPNDDLTAVVSLTHAPDGSGRKLAAMLVAHFGTAAQSDRVIARFRALARPVIDRLGPISYCALNGLLDPGFPRGALNYWKSVFVADLDDRVRTILAEQFRACPSAMSKLIVERPHGAALRQAPSATAFPHRAPGYSILVLGQWAVAEDSEENMFWVRETADRLRAHAKAGAYGNYLAEDEFDTRLGESFGDNLGRLRALKGEYDPENIFHHNLNIAPEAQRGQG